LTRESNLKNMHPHRYGGIAGQDGSVDHGFEGNKHGTTRAGLDEENGRRESSPSGWRED
jgi:hypothetical protein